MALEIDRNNCAFKKCGEISTFLPAGKKEFFLNCGFCELTFLELNNLIEHIFEDHSVEFLETELKEDVEDISLGFQEGYSSETDSHSKDADVDGHMLTGFETVEVLETHKSDTELEDKSDYSIKEEIINKFKFNNNKCPRDSSILDDAQCIILADIYKLHTCLWNEEDIAYRFKNRREESLRAVFNEFNTKTGLNLSHQDLKKEIILLRKICSNEKKLKISCKKTNSIHITTYLFYDYISFLEVDVAPFECSKCGKLLPGLGQLKVHFAEHDGSLPFICNICGHGFQLGTNLTVHLRRHVQDYQYNCEVCNKPCATTTEIKIHMRTHTGERPFVCSICGEKALTSSHLLLHMHRRHEKRYRHKCKLCPKMFYETKSLREHMAVHKNVRDQICGVCNKGFKNLKQLRQHQLIHNAEKKYTCKFCGKRFAQSSGLCGHMKTHGTLPRKLLHADKDKLN
ncbi:PREDICTED: zinc finger protein 287-like isoform X2 [Rhagoletis zephyria]|uniref:zinc finger protein 287-like isoform X2 n=1 Tax=Rhagoletis zephyria TaxID=28612 RepID=UPI000811A5ED|nr:PREDICTED: zinc finger protein 287-like isoform X2 [Rhagoletis zephyria]